WKPPAAEAHDECIRTFRPARTRVALADGGADRGDAVHRGDDGRLGIATAVADRPAPPARHRDPAAGGGTAGAPPAPPPASAAGRPAALAGAGRACLALVAVCADAGDAADRLGDALGRRLPDHDARPPAVAGDRTARPGA